MTRSGSWSFAAVLGAILVSLTVALMARWSMGHSLQVGTPSDASVVMASSASTDRLVRSLQARLAAGKQDTLSYSLLGNTYLQKVREAGDPAYYSLAEEAFKRALWLDPHAPEALIGTAALDLARHQFQEALDWGQRALEVNAGNPRVYGVLGDAYVQLGRYPEAWAAFQKMVNLRPDLSSYSRVSYARELTGDVPGAIEAMERALMAGGPNTESTAWTRVQLGNLHHGTGDLEKAAAQYRKALAQFPGYVQALAGLAKVAAAKGDYERSIALYQRVVERFPVPEHVMALGDVYAVAGHPQEAAKAYTLVRVQQRLYQSSGVNTDLEMALFEADHNQDLDSAVTRARDQYRRRPSILAAGVLAWTLYKKGEYQEALHYSREARRLGTKDALLLFHAGMINYALGNQLEARALLEETLAINPYFSLLYEAQARQTLQELQRDAGMPNEQHR